MAKLKLLTRFWNRKGLFVALAFIVVAILVKHFFFSSSAGAPTVTATRQNLEETLSLSGKIAASQDEILTFQTGGQLAWVGVKVGDRVKKYQGIASLDQRVIEKNLQKTMNLYLTNRWTFDQTKDDYNGPLTTTAIKRLLDQAQFSLNNTVLDVEITDLARQFANLWSPFDGLVIRADATDTGLNVTPLVTGFEIVNPDSVYFSATADQADVVKLSASQSGEITLDSYPDKILTGQIQTIAFSPKAGETGTVYEVKIPLAVDNRLYQYRLGMTGNILFITNRGSNVLTLPPKAVKTENDQKYVLLKKNNQKVKTPITTGIETDTAVEIIKGVSENDTVFLN